MSAVAEWLILAPRRGVILLIRIYQLTISPMLGPVCRFAPSCSSYGVEAIREHGVIRGGWLTARRLARCHPWNPGGYDPVPPARPSRLLAGRTARRTARRQLTSA